MSYEYIIKIEELESTQFMQRTEDALRQLIYRFSMVLAENFELKTLL